MHSLGKNLHQNFPVKSGISFWVLFTLLILPRHWLHPSRETVIIVGIQTVR